jgi:hypothetical protein
MQEEVQLYVHHQPQQQPHHVFAGHIPRVEAELELQEISVQVGLQPGGSRQFVFKMINSLTQLVVIDGFVQRVSNHDLKVVIRGTDSDVRYVIGLLCNIECYIQQIRYEEYHSCWPAFPCFKILEDSPLLPTWEIDTNGEEVCKTNCFKSTAGSAYSR